MNTYRITAIIVGILYIIGTVLGILSVVFTGATFNAPDVLGQVFANQNRVTTGALCVLLMGFSLAPIPVLLFPILKKQNEALALWYIVFRSALETITCIISAISWLLLLPLSQEYVKAGPQAAPYFHTIGAVIQRVGDLPMGYFVFCLGALVLYTLLYQSRLIPRWISVWGLVAILLHLTSGFLVLFGLQNSFDTSNWVMNFPILVQEMVMAVWLIAKGFTPSAMAAMPAKLAASPA